MNTTNMYVDVVVIVVSNEKIIFGSGDFEYTHTGFMQTLRDRKNGIYIPEDRSDVIKINKSFVDLMLDLKDELGYSVTYIADAAFKVGIRRIEYYCPNSGDIELYKLMKKINIALSKTHKGRMVFSGDANASYVFEYSEAELSKVKNEYIKYMDSEIRLSNERKSVRYINDDTISGYNSYFRHVGISQQGLLHLAFMAGVSSDYNLSNEDWDSVSDLIPLNYNDAAIKFADNAYNACVKLMNDDIFKQYNK